MTPADRTDTAGGARRTLAVVGGGIIGLTCALAAADAGWQVTVVDAGRNRRAAWVAGGMLGSLGEGHPGEDALLAISERSVRRWPAFIERLGDPRIATAADSLFVATTTADAAYLTQLANFVWSTRPHAVDRLSRIDAAGVRARERAIGARVRGGYLATGEGAVDNRRLLAALESALVAAGGRIGTGRVTDLADLDDADQILLAAGAGLADLWPAAPIHLAKGEVLRLRADRMTVPPPRHVIRARVDGRMVYLVPRHDGIVVGATQYEGDIEEWRSGEPLPQAVGVAELLADAIEVFPGARDYALVEATAGFRPCSPDGLPIIERLDERTVVAGGHGRNGIVLAPYTSEVFLELLADDGALVGVREERSTT
ncbi:thiamine biosynthesis oxidoreductase ThiO [Gordonia polyisoprenivorans NBRC 16320 = JCM 10675]|uniref:FAD-dependent oxidoreductase n=1 Tax=Gordonia polyisoprenivorans TaxID=84595 RepID=A0A846WFT9_9ACTN|nr:FAD-dependent oxidoreductase [Gordonia polyisoprenivorans]NKY00655.1 FAD-dependent oxidoreductase [Gordonia polyisoprenivorans]OZC33609.1 FAD-dependent oxidoreductase [Gordonia polyisoprenivorans]GAB22847.1 thiamine biosynthesis oxidoreductase ThiO [Gordonia polyisoprenivorans NBRC 16320 = JCM 10675]